MIFALIITLVFTCVVTGRLVHPGVWQAHPAGQAGARREAQTAPRLGRSCPSRTHAGYLCSPYMNFYNNTPVVLHNECTHVIYIRYVYNP